MEMQLISSQKMGEAEAVVGQIKVVVVHGKRLVIRDFKSSDPYVVLKLGNQVSFLTVLLLYSSDSTASFVGLSSLQFHHSLLDFVCIRRGCLLSHYETL